MDQIFISYKHNIHGALYELLITRLEANGYQVWSDEKLIPGEAWTKGIDNAINQSMALIVLMTKEAQASEYVTYEWSYALGACKPIITLVVDKVDLHPRLLELQFIDFGEGKKFPWELLFRGLDKIKSGYRRSEIEQAFRWMQEGDSELLHDDIQSALDLYTQAYSLADESLCVRIGYKMSRIYIQQSEKTDDKDSKAKLLNKAEDFLKSALEIRPNYHAARAYLAYIYRRKSDRAVGDDHKSEILELARANFKTSLEQHSQLLDHNGQSWWNTYGGVLRRFGEIVAKKDADAAKEYFEQAVIAYRKAADIRRSSYPFGNLAVLNMLLGKTKEMKAYYERVEYYPPTDAGDFWGYGDQLVAHIVRKDELGAEATYKPYMAFVEDYAIDTLLEMLQKIEKMVEPDTATLVTYYINRIADDRKQR